MKMFFYSVITAALLSCSASHANPAQIGLRQDEGTSEAVAEIKDLPGNVFGEIYRIPEAGETGNALYLRGNNLYCASGSRVLVFDVSSPLAPRLRSECSIDGGARQIVADDRAIYVTTRGNGLHIVDASDLDAIKYLKFYDTIELATGVDVAGDVLFVTLRGYGVEFIDVRDIRNPRHICLQKTIESQSCWYQDGYLYSGEWGKGKVTTIAASDMGHVSALGEVDLHGHGDGLCALGNRLYAATGCNSRNSGLSTAEAAGMGHGLDVFDISDPANPRFISRAQFDKYNLRGMGDWWTVRPSADGKTVFVADTFNGLYAVDLSDEKNPVVCGRIFMGKRDDPSAAGTFFSGVAVGDGVVYASGQHYGLLAIRCKEAKKVKRNPGRLPQNADARYAYDTPSESRFKAWRPEGRAQVRALSLTEDGFLLAACSHEGLAVLRKDEEGGLYQIAKGPMAFAADVSVRGGRVYVAEGIDGLGVYSLDNAGKLTEIARKPCADIADGYRMVLWVDAVNDRYLVVNDRNKGNVVLDLKDFPTLVPVLSHHLGTTWWDKYIADETTPDGILAASITGVGMSWMYLGDSPSKSARDKTFVPKGAPVTFRDGTVLVMGTGGMNMLEAGTVPAKVLGYVKGNFKGTPVWDGANTLAIESRQHREVKKADVTTFENASIIWREIIEGCPDRPVFWDGKIVLPGGYQGVLIEK